MKAASFTLFLCGAVLASAGSLELLDGARLGGEMHWRSNGILVKSADGAETVVGLIRVRRALFVEAQETNAPPKVIISTNHAIPLNQSATDSLNGGGTINVQSFFQVNNFGSFLTPGTLSLDIDGQFHDLTFSLAGLTNMNVVDQTGINLGAHAQNLVMNVDNIRFVTVPEPATMAALGLGLVAFMRRRIRK